MSERIRGPRAWLIVSTAFAVCTLTGCNIDKLLNLKDPDIINPSDLRSPAGAEAERIGALGRLNQATSGAFFGAEATYSHLAAKEKC